MLDHSQTEVPDRADRHGWIAPPAALVEWRDGLRDRLLRRAVGGFDAMLRACYGVSEFTHDPECLIRVARSQAHRDVRLADGTRIRAGDPILVLHFWNEHVLRFARGRPSLGWASVMRRRVSQSLGALAEQLESDPDWGQVRALQADTALFGFWRMYQARRVIRRFGFDVMTPPDGSRLRALRAFTDDCIVWLLTRAFNPAALGRQEFVRGRDEMWMSRQSLIRQYGSRAQVLANTGPADPAMR